MRVTDANRTMAAALAVAVGSGVWGIFWIPLRFLEDHGIGGFWSVAVVLGLPLVVLVPLSLWTGAVTRTNYKAVLWLGIGGGSAFVLYSAALVYTDVVRAIFLFYLMPVWAAILGRVVLGEPLSMQRIGAICLGFGGLWLLLGGLERWPLPENAGDFYGLLSGIVFAITVLFISTSEDVGAIGMNLSSFATGAVLAVVFGLMSSAGGEALPLPDLSTAGWIGVIIFCCCIGMPGNLMMYWGAKHLSPGSTGILMMSEVVVGTLSAVVLAETALGWTGFAGAGLITLAMLVDLQAQNRMATESG